MPVQFTCQHCASSLSVSSRKVGERVTCPKCRRSTVVPAREIASVLAAQALSPPQEAPPAETESAEEALRERDEQALPTVEENAAPLPPPPAPPAMVYLSLEDPGEDEVTWVYEDETPHINTDPNKLAVDFDKLALPRYVLYGQGILLGVVAFVALGLGILIGRSSAPSTELARGPARPCYLTGTIHYTSSSGAKSPDAGAVVMVVPQDHRPEQKLAIEGLRPDDPEPNEDLAALGQLKAIGGDYARASDLGTFKLRVPDTGEYFLLVVSKHAGRRSSERLDSVHLAQMGRYFLPAPDLLGDRRYRWEAESIQRDRDFSLTLD